MSGNAGSSKPRSCNWELTYVCNYRCPYCFFIPSWEADLKGMNSRHLACTADDWRRFWDRVFELYGGFVIDLLGGESFLYPDVVALIQSVSKRHDVHITTNLSWKPEAIIGVLDPEAISFTASFHPHFAKPGPFLERMELLKRSGFMVRATAVAYPPVLGQLRELRAVFQDRGFSLAIAPFVGKHLGLEYPTSYTEQEREVFPREAMTNRAYAWRVGEFNPFGKACDAGRLYFRVLPDGNIYSCGPVTSLGEAPIGNIKDPGVTLNAGPRTCPSTHCSCILEYIYLRDFDWAEAGWTPHPRVERKSPPAS